MSRARLIYDGDCGFCTWSAIRAERWVRVDAQIVPFQSAPLAEWGLTDQECAEAVQWIGIHGERLSGAQAVAAACRSGRQPWPLVGAVVGARALRWPADATYRWVARHRHRFPGATAACAMPDDPPAR